MFPIGGGERDRTDGLLRARQALSQLSYTPKSGDREQVTGDKSENHFQLLLPGTWHLEPELVGLGGLEPPTSRLSGVRSNQLSYRPVSGDRNRKTGDRKITVSQNSCCRLDSAYASHGIPAYC